MLLLSIYLYWKETIDNHSGDPRWRDKPEENKKIYLGDGLD